MEDISEKLSELIGLERERFSTRHNNMFAMGFLQLVRYYEFLIIVFDRYKEVSERFVKNTQDLQATIEPGTHESTEDQLALREEARSLTTSLHLEIESFYLFAKILLDKVARGLEFYFGSAQKLSLDSHDDLVKGLERYVEVKRLILPDSFLDMAKQLKKNISDHRDYEIAHEKSPRTLHGTIFNAEGGTKIASIKLYPKERDQQVETKLLDDLLRELDGYIGKVIELVTTNRDKTNLELLKGTDPLKGSETDQTP